MPDLAWDHVRLLFDPARNGCLPDVVIEPVDVEGWQRVIDLIRAHGWAFDYTEDAVARDLPSAREILDRRDGTSVLLSVWPVADLRVNFWPVSENRVDFDVDLRELQGQARLDLLCDLFRTLGRRLAKPVVMTAEGARHERLLGYDVSEDRVVLLADRSPSDAGG